MDKIQSILSCAGKRNIVYLVSTGLLISFLHMIKSISNHAPVIAVNLESDIKRLVLNPSPYLIQILIAVCLIQMGSKKFSFVISSLGYCLGIFAAFGDGFTLSNNAQLLLMLALFTVAIDYLSRSRKNEEKSLNPN